MPDEAERLLGILDERTQGILVTVNDIKGNITSLFSKVDTQQSRLDTLTAEHYARTKQSPDCTQTVNASGNSKMLLALIGFGNPIVTLIILLLLKKWGII